MNNRRWRIPVRKVSHAAFIVLTSALMVACAVPHIPARVVYEDPTNFVRLEPDPYVLPEFPQSQHGHPLAIGPEDVAAVLKGILVREYRTVVQILITGEASWEPVFRTEEIQLLASRIAEALGKAQPDERVTYYLSRPLTSVKREITSGGLYVHEGHLHFLLGNYRIVYGIPAYGMVYDRRYPMRPTAPKGFEITFQQADVVLPQRTSLLDKMFGRTKDELVIDLIKLGMYRLHWREEHRTAEDAGSGAPDRPQVRAHGCRKMSKPSCS